jgi:hypothetical protein
MEATTTPTTGTTTPTAPAPAPAAVAAPAPAERPSFAQAFASDAATQSPTADPEAATTQPADATTAPAPINPSVEKTGPIPFDVHKTALDNARTKAIAEYKEKVGWAETVDRAAYEEAAKIGQLYQRDKPAYIRQVMAEALANPELAPLVRSEAARVLGTRAPQPQSAVPDIPIVNEQGQVVGNLREIVSQHLAEFAAKELEPIKRDYATRQQAEQTRQEQAQLHTTVTTLYEQAIADLPQFKEHEQEIAAALDKIPGDPGTALYRAWTQVVLPKLNAASQAKTLDSLKTTAAASLANPASAAVTTAKRPRSFNDPSLSWT